MISPVIAAIAIALLTALAFGGGFAVADWRKGEELEKARSESRLLTASNKKCAEDVHNVKTAIQGMFDAAAERERKAREAMQQAQPIVERRKATITRIRSLPPVKLDMQCEAIQHEQIAYVQARQQEAQ